MIFGPQQTMALTAAVAVPRFRVVVGSGANYGGPAVSATTFLLGVAQTESQSGDPLTVAFMGKSKVFCSSAVSAYDKITASASSGVLPLNVASGSATAGSVCIGYALEAGSPGDLVSVMLQPPYTIGAL